MKPTMVRLHHLPYLNRLKKGGLKCRIETKQDLMEMDRVQEEDGESVRKIKTLVEKIGQWTAEEGDEVAAVVAEEEGGG